MRARPQSAVLLLASAMLAVVLTLAVSRGAVLARSTFQSSPLMPADTPEPPLPGDIITETPTPVMPAVGPGTPSPAATEPPVAPITPPRGFLPAPTLTNPDALLPLPSAAGQPPLVGPAAPPVEPSPAPTPTPAAVPSAAQLIDNAIVALSYAWLCCGVALLALGAAVVIWLARRSARR